MIGDIVQLCAVCGRKVHPGACFPWQGVVVKDSDASLWPKENIEQFPLAYAAWENLIVYADSLRTSPQQGVEILRKLGGDVLMMLKLYRVE